MSSKKKLTRKIAILVISSMLTANTAVFAAEPVELTLDESIAMALKNNPAIKIVESDKTVKSIAIDLAKADNSVQAVFTHISDTRSGSPTYGVGNQFNNQLGLTYNLYNGGLTESNIEKAKLDLKTSDADLFQKKQEVKRDAVKNYYLVLLKAGMVDVYQGNLNADKEHLKNVQAQFSVGTVAKIDVLATEVKLADDEYQLVNAQKDYDVAVATLNNTIGLPLNATVKLKEQLRYVKYDTALEDCIAQALKMRPEAAKANLGIEIANTQVKGAKSSNLPTITASAGQSWSDRNFPGTNDAGWSIGVTAKWGLYTGGKVKGQIQEAQADVDSAVLHAKQAKDSIQLDVRTCYLSMRAAERNIESTKTSIAKAEEDYKIAKVRYSAGVGTNTDVLDKETALTGAKSNYISTLSNYNIARAELDRAMAIAI